MKTRPLTYDQDRVKELRMTLIEACMDVMQDSPKVKKWSRYKKQLVLKMSSKTLPVLNEHSGVDGSVIKISFDSSFNNESSPKTTTRSEESGEV